MYTHRINIHGNFRDPHTLEWAGSGLCNLEGAIECPADLGDEVYDRISDELVAGKTSGTVKVGGVTYVWGIKLLVEDAG